MLAKILFIKDQINGEHEFKVLRTEQGTYYVLKDDDDVSCEHATLAQVQATINAVVRDWSEK